MEETQTAYLDSNVFIYSLSSEPTKREKCIEIIGKIVSGQLTGYTSVLTFDEIFWKIKKLSTAEKALKATEAFLSLPNLIFLSANFDTVSKAHSLIKEHKLDPRDAIHAASAIINGIYTIISDDPDFDKIERIKRKSIEEL